MSKSEPSVEDTVGRVRKWNNRQTEFEMEGKIG